MRELVYYVAASIDGFIAQSDGSFDAFPIEGDHMTVGIRDYADSIPTHVATALGITPDLSRFDTVVMGWNTYAVGYDQGIESPYAHLRQYVFSRTHTVTTSGVSVTAQNPVDVIRELKAETSGSDIWLCGGGQLASALVDEIDRLVIKVNPMVFGSGIPLFAGLADSPRPFVPASRTAFESGVVFTEYRRGSTEPGSL